MLSRRTTLSSNGHHSNGHDSQRSSPGRSTMSTKIMRRVSTIFTTGRVGKKQNSLDTIEQGSGRGSMESQLSIDDIRRPSGLGRPVSFSSTTQSLDLEESVPLEVEVHRFQRTASQPNLARTLTQKAIPSMKGRNKPQPPLPREAVMVHIPPLRLARSAPTLVPPPPIPVMPTLPTEVFTCILSFLHRRSVCTLATVNKAFCDAARAVLYGNLDLRVVPSRKYDGLCQMLASRRDLTDLVHTFFLHRWPPSFALSYPDGDPRIAMLSQSTAIFTIALQNMHQLTSLTLPSFDLTILRHHTAFGLRNLTFLNRKLSESEERELFTWLDGQTNIITLRFPNLQESEPRPVSPVADDGEKNFSDFLSPIQSPSAVSQSPQPSPSSFTSTFANIPPAPSLYPYNSPSLLPSLNTLHVTPTLATLLAPVRPVRHIVLNIDSTLYTGLRPAAIMSSLRDLNSLTFHFGKQVDKRTAEKMLLAAGSSLSGLVSENNDKPQEQLSELGLRVHFAGPGTDEAIYKLLTKVLSRFPYLHVLNLSYDPLSLSIDHHRNSIATTSDGSISPSPSRRSFISTSGSSIAPTQGHGGLLTPIQPNGFMSFPMPPGTKDPSISPQSPSIHERLTVSEELRIQSWRRGCVNLQSVTMFSGALWNRDS